MSLNKYCFVIVYLCELAEGEGVGCAEELWTVVVHVTHPARAV
jgi:hypothetical protein